MTVEFIGTYEKSIRKTEIVEETFQLWIPQKQEYFWDDEDSKALCITPVFKDDKVIALEVVSVGAEFESLIEMFTIFIPQIKMILDRDLDDDHGIVRLLSSVSQPNYTNVEFVSVMQQVTAIINNSLKTN